MKKAELVELVETLQAAEASRREQLQEAAREAERARAAEPVAVNVRIPRGLRDAYRAEAAREATTFRAVIQRALEEWLEGQEEDREED